MKLQHGNGKKIALSVISAVTLAAAPLTGAVGSALPVYAEAQTTITNQDIVDYAVSWVGRVHYNDASRGEKISAELSDGSASDCSWFIYSVMRHFGLMDSNPGIGYRRSVGWGAGQVPNTERIGNNIADALPGDVEFWDEGNNTGHVAIYIGDGKAVACNGYWTPEFMNSHNGQVGAVEITSYQTTIGRDPDSIWRIHGNGSVNLEWTNGDENLHRFYHASTGEHLYTHDRNEERVLVSSGWADEGSAWTSPVRSGTPVYRLYNPNSTEHHFTKSAGERDELVKLGWRYEGIGWYSDDSKSVPVYRLYNPNAYSMNHHYTKSAGERDELVKLGWRYEGIAWYAEK